MSCLCIYVFAACGIEEVFYLNAPTVAYNQPTYETVDYTAKYVAFRTEENQDDGGDYIFDGTAVYYKIYNNYSTMVTRNSAILSVNTSSNSSAAATRVIETYGYKALGSLSASGKTLGEPLIANANSSRSVYIRLTTNGEANYYTATEFTPKIIIGENSDTGVAPEYIPMRNGNSKSFDFGRNGSDGFDTTVAVVPSSSDDDVTYGTASSSGTWYVDMYAVSVGHDNSFTQYYSLVLHLGAIIFVRQQVFSLDMDNIELLDIFKEAYPEIKFSTIYDNVKKDYLVLLRLPDMAVYESIELYWAGGRLLTEEALSRKDNYTPILYFYPETIKNPETMTPVEIEKLKSDSLKESESKKGSAMFFYDFIYDGFVRERLESKIKEIDYLGLKIKIHEMLIEKARKVEKKILDAAKADRDIQIFLDELTVDAYYWRVISGTDRKSFHSLGIAIDILPKNLHGKQSYWAWARDKFGEDWVTLPFDMRWFPPEKVIKIFESEGFIWGGKWNIWDTMHFEYRPELLLYREHSIVDLPQRVAQ